MAAGIEARPRPHHRRPRVLRRRAHGERREQQADGESGEPVDEPALRRGRRRAVLALAAADELVAIAVAGPGGYDAAHFAQRVAAARRRPAGSTRDLQVACRETSVSRRRVRDATSMLALALLPVHFTAWTPGMLPLRHGRLAARPRACVLARAVVVAAPGEDWNATSSSPSQQLNWTPCSRSTDFRSRISPQRASARVTFSKTSSACANKAV